MAQEPKEWTVFDRADAFERSAVVDASTHLADFLPAEGASDFLPTLVELVRLDLALSWERQSRRPLGEYLRQYPSLRSDSTALAAVAFEEYRLRLRSGEPVQPAEYQRHWGVRTESWPKDPLAEDFLETQRGSRAPTPDHFQQSRIFRKPVAPPLEPEATFKLGSSANISLTPLTPPTGTDSRQSTPFEPLVPETMPAVGDRVLGFELLELLGRGASGSVFLASQGDLAGRKVALKIGYELFAETKTLAQLQHTNIVPIFSAHKLGPWQAVCMPYCGRVTLAALIQKLNTQDFSIERTDRSGATLVDTWHRIHIQAGGSASATAANENENPFVPQVIPSQLWGELRQRSYIDACVWLIAQLCAGLAHAHVRGILHRDLKPANILLTDDGVPTLLDFSLAEDTKSRGQFAESIVGGTLPYMAPEQFKTFLGQIHAPEVRNDLYSLGVILYELLAGTRPFPDHPGEPEQVIPQLLADRQRPFPSLRALNPEVPVSLERLIARLLHPNPDGRYQSAAALHADLNRFLDRLPLREVANPWSERTRNWIRRNPSLTSTATVATVAAVLLASAGATGYLLRERSRTLEARVAFTDHLHSQSELQALIDDRNQTPESLSQQVQLGHQLLSRYRVPSDHRSEAWQEHPLVRYLPEPERQALRKQIGEVFYLLAKSAALRAKLTQDAGEQARELQQAQQWNEHAAHYAQESIPRAILEQRADLLLAAGDAERAEQVRREVRELDPASSRDRYLLGYWQHHQGRLRAAVRELQLATDEDPTQFSTWFVLGNTYLALGQAEAAARCFTAAIALRPHFAPARLNRGMAFTRLRLYREAEADLTEAAKSEKTRVEALIQRGGVAQAQGRIDDAIADYSEALTYDRCPSRVYFYRAASKDACGDKRGAAEDRERGMKEAPQDELSWVARAEQRLAQDATAALADVQSALKLNPTSFSGLQLLAHIQAEHLHQIPQAIQTLDRAIQWYPESAVLLAGRGVLLARSGSRELAHRDGGQALRFDSSGQNLFQVGCIYAQTARTHPEDRFRACELLTAALKAGFGHALLSRDSDLEPIRKSPEFQVLIQNNSRMKSR